MKRSKMINKLKEYHWKVYPSVGVDKKYTIEGYFAMLLDLVENNGMAPPSRGKEIIDIYNRPMTLFFNKWEDE